MSEVLGCHGRRPLGIDSKWFWAGNGHGFSWRGLESYLFTSIVQVKDSSDIYGSGLLAAEKA